MPWQQAKAARPKGDIAAPYVPTLASSQSVKALQYQFDELTKQFQTILESLPPIDDSNPTVPIIQSLEEQVSTLEDAQQRKQAEIDAELQHVYGIAERIYTLWQTRLKILRQTIAQLNAQIAELDNAKHDNPEWVKEREEAITQRDMIREEHNKIWGFTNFVSLSKAANVRQIHSYLTEERVRSLPHSDSTFERLRQLLGDDAKLAALKETFEKVSAHIDKLTTDRAAIGREIYHIKVDQNLDDMKSQLHRDIEHQELVQSICDTFTSRGRDALARHTTSVSNSTVGSIRQFFYEAEKILKVLTDSPSVSHVELGRLHRVLRELPLD
jgi:DNA repair exonuclease SbcCD ATPase subunit